MKKIIDELRRISFIDYSFAFIESNYISRQFYGACKSNESLNEFYSLEEKTQIGVQLSAQISHCFYSFLKYDLNDYFKNKNSFLRVITIREQLSNESYDLIFVDINTNEKFKLEIKLSQNKNSWQGSTSSTSKVDDFLLINFSIDRNKKLSIDNNKGLFIGIFGIIINIGNRKWSGEAKKNSHRTKFELKISDWDSSHLKENNIIKGDIVSKQVLYHLVLDNLNYEHIK
jgi:hypothetical protein